MDKPMDHEPPEVARWLTGLYSLLSFVLGSAVLGGVWWFYRDRIDGADFHWYHWIQPVLIVCAALLCWGAAIGFLRGNRVDNGMQMLKGALAVIPIILALRLVIVAFVFLGKGIGWIKEGASFEGFSMVRSGLWVPIVIIAVIIVSKLLSKKNSD